MKYPPRMPRITLEQKNRVLQDYLSRFTYKEIAQRNSISVPSVVRIIKQAQKAEAENI